MCVAMLLPDSRRHKVEYDRININIITTPYYYYYYFLKPIYLPFLYFPYSLIISLLLLWILLNRTRRDRNLM